MFGERSAIGKPVPFDRLKAGHTLALLSVLYHGRSKNPHLFEIMFKTEMEKRIIAPLPHLPQDFNDEILSFEVKNNGRYKSLRLI
ncbi:MAG: hypothetical protein Q8O93_05900 [bacterium]|nr:hypothetical protein [bacterium]